MNKHIAFVITGLNGGGAERQLQSLACGLRGRGYRVSVISMIRPDNMTVADALESSNIPVYYLDMQRGKIKLSAIFKLASLIKKLKPDIVHSNMVHANILARVSRIFCKMPRLICTAHSSNECGGLLERLYRITDRLADITTQISNGALERYVERKIVPRNKIRHVPNGISPAKFEFNQSERERVRRSLGIAESRFMWLTVARMEPPKDYATLLAAMGNLPQNALLLVAGDGEDRPSIEKFINERNLTEKVMLLGFRNDIPALMSASDAFVLSSLWEGLPLVVIEAMCAGLPVVSSNVGGQVESILDGKSGYLVPVKDSASLGEAMRKIQCLDIATRKKMGEAGRKHALENYDIEKILDLWERVYGLKTA